MRHAFPLVLALSGFVSLVPAVRADEAIPFTTHPKSPLRWYDAKNLDLEGRGWKDVAVDYDRLPARAEKIVRPAVWGLSQSSSGMCVHFVADTPSIDVHWKLRKPALGMPHMAPTGVSGVDLYGRTDDGKWRWIGCGRPSDVDNRASLARELPAGKREYRLYLPLYNGVSLVEGGFASEGEIGGRVWAIEVGGKDVEIKPNTLASRLFGNVPTTRLRFRHRYEVDPRYIQRLEEKGMIFSGKHPTQPIMQVLELPQEMHPYFVGTQAHPEMSSRPLRPQPFFVGLVKAAMEFAEGKKKAMQSV